MRRKSSVSLLYIGVVCVNGMESLIFFIVGLLVLCGMFSLVDLRCLGLCLDKSSTCMLVDRLPATLKSAIV